MDGLFPVMHETPKNPLKSECKFPSVPIGINTPEKSNQNV